MKECKKDKVISLEKYLEKGTLNLHHSKEVSAIFTMLKDYYEYPNVKDLFDELICDFEMHSFECDYLYEKIKEDFINLILVGSTPLS